MNVRGALLALGVGIVAWMLIVLTVLAAACAVYLGWTELLVAPWAMAASAASYALVLALMLVAARYALAQQRRAGGTGTARWLGLASRLVRERPATTLLLALAAGAFLENRERSSSR